MADGIVTTLLENIKETLGDTTNYAAIADALEKVFVSGEFKLHPKASPYAVIVPGSPDPLDSGATVAMWWQPVNVHIVMRRLKTPKGERTLLGTDGTNGLETLAKDARQALCRHSPYNAQLPTGSGYATQTGVLIGRYDGQSYLGEEEGEEQKPSDVVVLHTVFLCAENR